MIKLDAITKDMKFNGCADINFQINYESDKIIKAHDCFYYINGRFCEDEQLISILTGDIPSFIKTQNPISPRFYLKTLYSDCTQFLVAFNIYLGGDLKLSNDAMTDFFHNLSKQALSKSDDSVFLKFENFTELVKNINILLK